MISFSILLSNGALIYTNSGEFNSVFFLVEFLSKSNFLLNIIFLKQMAYDAKFLRIPEIRWLGAFPSDSEKYSLPQQCLLPLTAEGEMDFKCFVLWRCYVSFWLLLQEIVITVLCSADKARTEALLLRCYLQREEPQWRLIILNYYI